MSLKRHLLPHAAMALACAFGTSPAFAGDGGVRLRSMTEFLAFPSLGPATHDEVMRTGWHDQVQVAFQEGIPIQDPETMLLDSLWGQSLEARTRDDSIPGCKGYLGESWRDDVYDCQAGQSTARFIMFCKHGDAYVVYPYCNVYSTVTDKVTVNYSFSRSYMAEVFRVDGIAREQARDWAANLAPVQ